MNKILLIEDDPSLGPSLKEVLEREGFSVNLKSSLIAARSEDLNQYQIILLDWMLPDGQGIDFLRDIRAKENSMPVIMLTARTELVDKVLGLETGANDYLTKPFETRELVARVRVQLRSHGREQTNHTEAVTSVKIANLFMNQNERLCQFNEAKVTLTKMEFDLLYLLASNPKQIFSREKLLDKVWGLENFPTTRTVDTHILQLRQKLASEMIETIRGVGYRFAIQK